MLVQISVLSSNSVVVWKKKKNIPRGLWATTGRETMEREREQVNEEILLTKREKVTGGWTNLQNERLYLPPNTTDYAMKDEIDGACRARQKEYQRVQNCGWKIWSKKGRCEYLGVAGQDNSVLKCICNKYHGRCGLDLFSWEQRPVASLMNTVMNVFFFF
jgi:hypothetical protein